MADVSWLSSQARQIHDIFFALFYTLITVFLLLGVFIEYFKWPLGNMPSFSVLIGRALIAAILLYTYPEVTNTLADVVEALCKQLGDLNQIHDVLQKSGEKAKEISWSWTNIRESITLLISFVTYFILYYSVFITEALMLYTWTILYVFSPVLIALYVLPATAPATSALYRSLIEVSLWKVVWTVLSTLLWTAALSKINQPGYEVNFVTVICLNLILAGSLLLTPKIVHSLAGSGLSALASTVGGVAVGASMIGPLKAAKVLSRMAGTASNAGLGAVNRLTSRFFPEANKYVQKMPEFNIKRRRPIFRTQKPLPPRNASTASKPSASLAITQSEPPKWITEAPVNTSDPPPWIRHTPSPKGPKDKK